MLAREDSAGAEVHNLFEDITTERALVALVCRIKLGHVIEVLLQLILLVLDCILGPLVHSHVVTEAKLRQLLLEIIVAQL